MNTFQHIKNISNCSDEACRLLSDIVSVVEFKKGEYLLQEGKICTSNYLIVNGYCKAFYIQDGEEIITNFYFKNDFATNIKSLKSGEKSQYSIKTCEKTTIFSIEKDKIYALYNQYQELEKYGREILEKIIIQQEEYTDMLKLLTAKQRYEYIEKNKPILLQLLPLSQIASYIGVKRETLSRIRSQKLKK